MEINLNLGLNDKIEAINLVLEALGSVGINTEEELDYNIDAASADKLIDALSQRLQSNKGKGFWFNRESFHKLIPDKITGNVVVPNNTIACLVKRQDGKALPITLRGNNLFDTEELGYNLTTLASSDGTVPCVLVVFLQFDYLPATAKQAVTDLARYWIVNDKEGDLNKLKTLEKASQESISALMAEDASQRRRNMFQNTAIANDVMSVGGYNNVGGF